MGLLIHELYVVMFASLSEKHAGACGDYDPAVDETYAADLDYATVQGRRFKSSLYMLRDEGSRQALTFLVIVLEPLRCLCRKLMRLACEIKDPCKRPDCLDLFSAKVSPVVHALQYLGALLVEDNGRLMFVWRRLGLSSTHDWETNCKTGVRGLRRAVLCLSASIHIRFVRRLDAFPWLFLRLADDRIGIGVKQALVQLFLVLALITNKQCNAHTHKRSPA